MLQGFLDHAAHSRRSATRNADHPHMFDPQMLLLAFEVALGCPFGFSGNDKPNNKNG